MYRSSHHAECILRVGRLRAAFLKTSRIPSCLHLPVRSARTISAQRDHETTHHGRPL
jgi:hypothetical protein